MARVYSNLHVDGTFVYNNNPQEGYVLTTDNVGLVSWTASSALISVASDTEFGHIKVGSGLTMSGSGYLSSISNANVNENKAIYIDATYGNDTTGVKYDLAKPFLTWLGAMAVAVSGDWIIFNAGSYGGGSMTPVSNINVFCRPGVTISGGFLLNSGVTWKFLGHAIFTSTDALRVVSTGQTYDIQFDFDKIEGVVFWGIILADNTSPSFKIRVNCNSITASRPLRFNSTGGVVYDAVINCRERITAFGQSAVIYQPSGTPSASGTIVVNSPIIENIGSSTGRVVIEVTTVNGSTSSYFKSTINASIIRSTSSTFVDNGISNYSAVVMLGNTDNVTINGDLDGGPMPCIVNYSGGASPVYGCATFNGNMYSDREIVQHYCKFANGNGWLNIVIKNGYISTKGIGLSNAMFNRADTWNTIHGGIPGNIQIVDCVLHNRNYNASSTAAIMRDDVRLNSAWGNPVDQNNFQMYNSMAYIDGGVGYLVSTYQASKLASFHNVRSNVDKNIVVTDTFSPTGLIVDTNLIIPKNKL
jgi:hypothetical protein